MTRALALVALLATSLVTHALPFRRRVDSVMNISGRIVACILAKVPRRRTAAGRSGACGFGGKYAALASLVACPSPRETPLVSARISPWKRPTLRPGYGRLGSGDALFSRPVPGARRTARKASRILPMVWKWQQRRLRFVLQRPQLSALPDHRPAMLKASGFTKQQLSATPPISRLPLRQQ